MQIILASQSKQRKAMMDTLGIEYTIRPADINELAITAPNHYDRAALVAKGKGEKIRALVEAEVKAKHEQQDQADHRFIIMAADTYLCIPETGGSLEKPISIDEAREMLTFQSGKSLEEYTGVYWYDSASEKDEGISQTISTKVTFRDLTAAEIEQYVTTEPVKTWSGAFCPAYDTGAALIASIEGSFTGFTHGFPLEFFAPKLSVAGVLPK